MNPGVEFFGKCDTSGYGEGARFLQGETVTTDASGHAAGSFGTARWRPFFWFPTGTATIGEGGLDPDELETLPDGVEASPFRQAGPRTSTSELSPCFNDIAF